MRINRIQQLILTFSILCCSMPWAMSHGSHEGSNNLILAAERYWMQNGLQSTLTDLQTANVMSNEDFSGFVYTNRDSLFEIKQTYFSMARRGETYQMNDLEGFWTSKQSWIKQKFQGFKNRMESDPTFLSSIRSVMRSSTSQATQSFVTNCANVGFESGTVNWDAFVGNACYHNPQSPDYTCFGFAGSTFGTGPNDRAATVTGGYDPIVGGTDLPMLSPFGGTRSVRLENYVNGGDASKVSYEFKVSASQPFFSYQYAVVLEDPGTSHPDSAKPFFAISMYDHTDGEFITCAEYEVFANPQDKEFGDDNLFIDIPGNQNIKYKKWSRSVIPLNDRINHDITLSFIVSDCPWGGHLGYAYIDATCWAGNIDVGACEPDGTRVLEAPAGFDIYNWKGHEITKRSGEKVHVRGQGPFFAILTPETGCPVTLSVMPDTCPQPPDTSCLIDIVGVSLAIDSCDTTSGTYNITFNINFTDVDDDARLFITDGMRTIRAVGPFSGTETYSFYGLHADGKSHQIKAYIFKDDFTAYSYELCFDALNYTAPNPCYIPLEPVYCDDCIASFAPIPGETYIVSAWVRDQSASPTDITYSNPEIVVYFDEGTVATLLPSGPIVEGWQRIFMEVTIPAAATEINVQLTTNSGSADFDDVRIFPKDGHMKSFVYDPVSLRLVATLDENNYATFYEYDKEGNLVRSKKETSRGIVTVSENRQSNPK